MIRVLLADDQRMVLQGMRALLEKEAIFQVVGEARDGGEAISMARELEPDVAILDISMPVVKGIEAARKIKNQNGRIQILLITQYDCPEYLFPAFGAGASGFILKSAPAEELIWAIRTVHKGLAHLSPEMVRLLARGVAARSGPDGHLKELTSREREVFSLLAEGLSCREIAERLVISPKTAYSHKANIMKKLKLSTSAQLIKYAIDKNPPRFDVLL